MSRAPYTLILLVPPSHASLPPHNTDLRWTPTAAEDGAVGWTVHPASGTDAELSLWDQAERLGEDAPLVQVDCAASDQCHVPLPGHLLVRLTLPTALRAVVRTAPQGWAVAAQVTRMLHVAFAWSGAEDAVAAGWARGERPWTRVWPTMMFHGDMLKGLGLDPRALDDMASGGDVFRVQHLEPHWWVQAPEGLGNQSAALLGDDAVDEALTCALQRVSARHDQAVQVWLNGAQQQER